MSPSPILAAPPPQQQQQQQPQQQQSQQLRTGGATAIFDASTSETGDGGSILFSEQVHVEPDFDLGGPSRYAHGNSHPLSHLQGHAHAHAQDPSTSTSAASMSTSADGDGDDRGRGDDEMASHFFYVEEDTGTPGIVAGEVTPEAERERERGTVDAMDEDDNPEVNFWMECIQDPDAAEGETGATAGGGEGEGQGEKNGEGADAHDPETTPKASRRPRPTSSGKRPRTHDQPTDADAGETERHVSDDERTFVVDDDESMDSDDSTDAEGGVSYHSGDSEEYEMKHRPWLERTAVKKDIVGLYNISGMWNGALGTYRYRVVDRLGEGTFSSVYLAYDELHNLYNNNYWTDKESTDDLDMLYETSSAHKVALKKILVTSSPSRIENELSILENLRGCRNVSPLISAFRDQDQVVIVLPFHRSDDFRYFYALMDPPKIKQYMTCLLRGLKDIHARGILHRDVKPANFLFDYERGDGLLVDFGLAERYNPPRRAACQHTPASRAHLHGSRTRTGDTAAVEQAVYDAAKRAKSGDGRIGFRQEDARPPIKTNRAGTRGFRAPEVLLKCPDQTVAIDIWSAGVMLMSILAHKFPIFNSADDIEALMEIAAIFGRKQMERCAFLHNRTIITNVPEVDHAPDSLASLILRSNPNLYTPRQHDPTPEEALEHITAIDHALDLCTRLLRLDATTRLTAAEALRHPFLGHPDDDGPDELLDPTEGKCGHLHEFAEDGTHQARFGNMLEDMRFGQGIPTSRTSLCPEHEHWQQRSGVNPLSAAYGATLDEEYYQHAGYHLLPEHVGYDDCAAQPDQEVRWGVVPSTTTPTASTPKRD